MNDSVPNPPTSIENQELCKNASDIFQEIEKKLVAME